MYSIKKEVQEEIVIKHSRFLSYAKPVFTKDEAQGFLSKIKKAHPDANHHCFAYSLGDEGIVQKAEDDGEPSKTAGMPILETLKKNTMTNIIIVVVRYFGGIKLGAGGLIRAYGKAASGALEKAVKTKPVTLVTLEITIPFDLIGVIEHELESHTHSIERRYDSSAHFIVTLREETIEPLKADLKEKTSNQSDISVLETRLEYL